MRRKGRGGREEGRERGRAASSAVTNQVQHAHLRDTTHKINELHTHNKYTHTHRQTHNTSTHTQHTTTHTLSTVDGYEEKLLIKQMTQLLMRCECEPIRVGQCKRS